MKFFRYILFYLLIVSVFCSCEKNSGNIWNVEISQKDSVNVVDISKEFYDEAVTLEQFKAKYNWFQGTVSDEDFAKRKIDSAEIRIYRDAIRGIDVRKLNNDLADLFARIKHYFPDFQLPKVYLFSSALQMSQDPIMYVPEQQKLFIDITGFMGENNENYQGLELYFRRSMNPKNIVPKISQIIAETMVPINVENQKFIDILINNGKIMLLQDAFLPKYPDYMKINYTPEQYEWVTTNEANIWNYFVENDLIFSDDSRLSERFIAVGPFSKFYTAIDNESSPQVGIFIGWQICKKFYKEQSKMPLHEFLNTSSDEIFNKSEYKPKN